MNPAQYDDFKEHYQRLEENYKQQVKQEPSLVGLHEALFEALASVLTLEDMPQPKDDIQLLHTLWQTGYAVVPVADLVAVSFRNDPGSQASTDEEEERFRYFMERVANLIDIFGYMAVLMSVRERGRSEYHSGITIDESSMKARDIIAASLSQKSRDTAAKFIRHNT